MWRILRYVLSGYLLKRKDYIYALSIPNKFEETKNKYVLPKIVVYTVNIGGYDNINEPVYVDNGIDYVIITDKIIKPNSIWKKIGIETIPPNLTQVEKSRYPKLLPHLFFKDYDLSVYVDGNIQIAKDIRPIINTMIEQKKIMALHRHSSRDCIYHEGRIIWAQGREKLKSIIKQLWHYKKEGFPKNYGLFENNIIFRFHNDEKCIKVMETWWYEFHTYSKRDQLSFTYSLWKNEMKLEDVMSLGNNARKSDYFLVVNHKK